MGNLKKGRLYRSCMDLLAILGSIASIVGTILTVVYRIMDVRSKKHRTKKSNRHLAKD